MTHGRSSLLTRHTSLAFIVTLILTAALHSACGGDSASPTSPTAAGGVTLNGSVIDSSASSSAGVTSLSGSSSITSRLVVSLVGSETVSAMVGTDGTFTLRGLPQDSFSLAFTRDGKRIGTLTFSLGAGDSEIDITVSVTSSSVVLLQDVRNGAGHGDIELEGNVEQVLFLSTLNDSRFVISSRTVVVRPAVTVIRDGNKTRLPADLTAGTHVHVKGTFLPAEGSVIPVLASEIRIQTGNEGEDDDGDGPKPKPSPTPSPTPGLACMIDEASPGRRVELEGRIASGDATSFKLAADHVSSPVDVLAGTATLECSKSSEGGGNGALTPAQCRALVMPGARVEVSGTLQACTRTSALVSASRITVRF